MLTRKISYYLCRNGVWSELYTHTVSEGSAIPRMEEIVTGFPGATSEKWYTVTNVVYNVSNAEVKIELVQT